MESVVLKVVGESPLLMHSDKFANPLDPAAREHSALVKRQKKEKTQELMLQVMESEWYGCFYWDDAVGPYIPGQNFKSALEGGAKMSRKGSNIRRGVLIADQKIKLDYEGPRNREAMYADQRFIDYRSVGVSGTVRVMRCRPRFMDWGFTVRLFYSPEMIDQSSLVDYARTAGQFIGLGDYRPDCGGQFGRFSVEMVG